ncbi:MAG: gliding motility-associated C-terminal domain-containing protein [Saprospirales bacterium]|nr:gliding motility-associated C-terminal domain-containing protein [Saprospirales bacterium]MBK8921307.1 gliding motility-associated C-terminal domain-containing protein [Saprospirales bacterium]
MKWIPTTLPAVPLIACIAFSVKLNAQDYFARSIASPDVPPLQALFGKDLEVLPDGYSLVGWRATDNFNGMVINTDPQGMPRWAREYDAGYQEWFNLALHTGSGELIIGWNDPGDTIQPKRAGYVKLDANGNVLWSNTITPATAVIRKILPLGDGYLLVGETFNSASSQHKIMLVKFDGSGATLWQRIWDAPNHITATAAVEIPAGGGFYVLGQTRHLNSEDAWIGRFTADGLPVFSKRLGSLVDEEPNNLALLSDGRLVMNGWIPGANDIAWLTLLDDEGNPQWSNIYQPTFVIYKYVDEYGDLHITPAGDIFFVNPSSPQGSFIVRASTTGVVKSVRFYPDTHDDPTKWHRLDPLPDGSWAAIGSLDVFEKTVCLAQLDSLGGLAGCCSPLQEIKSFAHALVSANLPLTAAPEVQISALPFTVHSFTVQDRLVCAPPPDPYTIGNAFTPNDDQTNDTFQPDFLCPVTAYKFQVFNRWGLLVFETREILKGWDGRFGGSEAPSDTYVWVLHYELIENGARVPALRKGNVTLLR